MLQSKSWRQTSIKTVIFDTLHQWHLTVLEGVTASFKADHVIAMKLHCGADPELTMANGRNFKITFEVHDHAALSHPEVVPLAFRRSGSEKAMATLLAEYQESHVAYVRVFACTYVIRNRTHIRTYVRTRT